MTTDTKAMLLNYLKLSFRLMARNPFFTLINVTGLSIGFAVFYVLWQYSAAELKSDQQSKDWERVARLGGNWIFSDFGQIWETLKFGNSAPFMGPQLLADYPELESFTRIMDQPGFDPERTPFGSSRITVTVEADGSTRHFTGDKIVCADTNVFSFFSIPLLAGDAESVLQKENSIVISKSRSRKYFGEEPALGNTLLLNNQLFEVTGVFQDLPHNTHMDFAMIISNVSKLSSWTIPSEPDSPCMVYLKSRNIMNWQRLEERINHPTILQKYTGEVMEHIPGSRWTHKIEPLSEIAYSEWGAPLSGKPTKSKTMLVAFQLIGTVVLLLAVINYILLSTAKITSRLKEVGVRRVSGAGSSDFFKQFIAETCMTFAIALVLAFTLVQLFKAPTQVELHIATHYPTFSVLIILGIAAFVSITICSAYPTRIALAFQPRTLLRRDFPKRGARAVPLTLFQYGTAVVLIVFSFAIYRQISFVLKQSLGFKKENVIVIDAPILRSKDYDNEIRTFVHKIVADGTAEMATVSRYAPGYEGSGIDITIRKSGNQVSFDSNGGVDENFIPFYNLKIVAGRNFLPDEKSDVIILSEGALSRLGFTDPVDAVGNTVRLLVGEQRKEAWKDVEIIGIVKEYRLRSLIKFNNAMDDPNRGIGLTYRSSLVPSLTVERISIRPGTADVARNMASIGREYAAMFPGNPFNWSFLDDRINNQYQSEKILRNQLLFFTTLAIGIACLGLLGMISNKALQKTKEIGIRKVLGARLHQIASMLLKTTVKQITLAAALGIPAAYFLNEEYLQKFSERIELQWWHYALPVGLLILIMLATVAVVVWRAAKSNPVEALKYE